MIRRFVVVAGTLSLIACASQGTDDVAGGSSQASVSSAGVPVRVIENARVVSGRRHPASDVVSIVRSRLDLRGYREARVEEISDAANATHLVVQLLVEGQHALEVARIDLDASFNVERVTRDYARTQDEELHSIAPTYRCPDPNIQFIAFCPNDYALELRVTNVVANAAEAAGLKTVRLLKQAATHDAWLDYMTCPKLVGNFYDGDANPYEIVVYDGSVTARELASSAQFNLQTTNVWVACQAYKDPMLSAVQKTGRSQKYAAGVNDLQVGPSDDAAACAMRAALAGQPMTSSFENCYRQLDTSFDHWGFGGNGTDTFGVSPDVLPPLASSL